MGAALPLPMTGARALAILAAAEPVADADPAPAIAPGSRVIFRYGGQWLHGRAGELSTDAEGRPALWVTPGAVWWHLAGLDDVRRVCGRCPDCRALNDRPACAVAPEL